jgi:aldehyde dehydrogenase
LAVDKAHEAFQTWEKLQLRSAVFYLIAQVIEDNLEPLLKQLTTGKRYVKQWPDIPSDHFRYFASVIRAEESSIAELDS